MVFVMNGAFDSAARSRRRVVGGRAFSEGRESFICPRRHSGNFIAPVEREKKFPVHPPERFPLGDLKALLHK